MLIELRTVSKYHTSVWVERRAGNQPRMVPSVMAGPYPPWWEGGPLSSSLPGMPLAGLQSSAHKLGDGVLSWLSTPGGTWWKTTVGEPAEGPHPDPEGPGLAILCLGCPCSPWEAHLKREIQEQMAKRDRHDNGSGWQEAVRRGWKQLVQPLAGWLLRSLWIGPCPKRGGGRAGASAG